ncbi:hypothetical protein AAFF_G00193600 [Aldrovandia affinis]|uniref:Reverse transcriptase n=1 Tax=Aldrovandia affinis TaxID=143900 RepID=A0AAD7WUX6_9TELE|nr:hypothetical protein AAFF_G00193600 [Aldrovandia affinis]
MWYRVRIHTAIAPTPTLPQTKAASSARAEALHEPWERRCVGLDQSQREQVKRLIDDHADLFAVHEGECAQTKLVQHTIETGDAAPIRYAKRQIAEAKITEMAAAGVIEHSASPWATPAILVKKKGGDWRFCVDYRRLNEVARKDVYLLPQIDEALDYIVGSSWFSSLDLRSG